MIRILSFFLFFNLFAYGEEIKLVGVTPEDQTIIESHPHALARIQERYRPAEIQYLYDSGQLLHLLQVEVISVQGKEGSLLQAMNNPEIQKRLEENTYAGVPPEELMELIEKRAEGTKLGAMMKRLPRLKVFMAHWMSHEDAMPRFMQLLSQKRKLRNVGVFCVIIFILMYLFIEKWTHREPLMFLRIFKKWIGRVSTFWFCLFLFYFVFRHEVGPTWQIFKKYFIFKTA